MGKTSKLQQQVLFQQQSDGVTYRVPALIYLKHNQTFLAFAEKRSSPSDNDAGNFVMRKGTSSVCGCIEWSSAQELKKASLSGHRTMCPCPVYEEEKGILFLFFICVKSKVSEHHQISSGKNAARLCYVTSSDDGNNWSQVKDLTDEVRGGKIDNWATFAVGPGHGIQLESKRLIIPAYAYDKHKKPCSRCKGHQYAFSFYSDDLGQTWNIGEKLQTESGECQMAEIIRDKSYVYCNARTKGHHRLEALSDDGGVRFDKSRMATALTEEHGQGCQGSVIGFPACNSKPNDEAEGEGAGGDTWLLFTHPTGKRRDLGVYLNRFPLHSGWELLGIIHSGPSGYSDLAYSQDKQQLSCLMECGEKDYREQIVFVSFSTRDLMQMPCWYPNCYCSP